MVLINSENKYNEVLLAYGKKGYKLRVPTNFDVIEPKFIEAVSYTHLTLPTILLV